MIKSAIVECYSFSSYRLRGLSLTSIALVGVLLKAQGRLKTPWFCRCCRKQSWSSAQGSRETENTLVQLLSKAIVEFSVFSDEIGDVTTLRNFILRDKERIVGLQFDFPGPGETCLCVWRMRMRMAYGQRKPLAWKCRTPMRHTKRKSLFGYR
jgi:hypothetical protein